MFEACEAFVWCLKDHFYAIYRRFYKNNLKKVKKLQSGIFGLFGLQWLPGFQTLIVAIFQDIQAKKTKNINQNLLM